MAKEYINPKTLFPSLPIGFSQVVTSQSGKTVYISGQTAWDVDKRIIGGTDLGEQAKQALRNLRSAVEAAGGTLADVVAIRIYVVDYKTGDAQSVSEALKEFFPEARPPASTWIGVSSLASADFLIEIEATAVVE